MDSETRLGWRFVNLADLRARAVLDPGGSRLGSVAAAALRLDGGVDLLVREDDPRGRVLKVSLDDLEIDDDGVLWLHPPRRLWRIAVLAKPAGSLTER